METPYKVEPTFITSETNNIIKKQLEKMFELVEESIMTGCHESGINVDSPEYYDTLDATWYSAMDLIKYRLDKYSEEK